MHILFLTQILPFPPASGPKVKTWHVLRYLADCGHKITLVSFVRPEEVPYVDEVKKVCTAVYTVPVGRSKMADLYYFLRSQVTGRPFLVERDDLPRIILADGMLMYYLDVAEVLKAYPNMDWDLTIRLAREWGAVDILSSVLSVCRRYFDAPIPGNVFDALAITRPWAVTRQLMGRAAEQELAAYEGRATSRFWNLLLASNGAFILRPVRMLETLSYFFPPADFLRRRYSEATLVTRARHFFTAFLQTLRFGWDTFYFGMERYFRLKRQGKSASLFNKLETHL